MEYTQKNVWAILQIIPASIGALLGSILTLSFFLLIQFALHGSSEAASFQAISQFLLFGISFVSALSSNVIASVFLALYTRETFFGKFREAMTHIFFCNTIVMLLASPFFLLLPSFSSYRFASFLLPFLAISSALLYALFAQKNTPISAAYTAIVTGVCVAGIANMLLPTVIPYEMAPFFFLPLVWAIIPAVSLCTQKIFFSLQNILQHS